MIEEGRTADAGEESMIILQSLLCLLREKNLLTRSDIEDLCAKVAKRSATLEAGPLPCRAAAATAAKSDMQQLSSYIGQTYGGKRRPWRAGNA